MRMKQDTTTLGTCRNKLPIVAFILEGNVCTATKSPNVPQNSRDVVETVKKPCEQQSHWRYEHIHLINDLSA